MYEFCYNYVVKKQNFVIWITDSFIVHVKTDHIYKYIAEGVERRFDPAYYELGTSLPKGKNEKATGLMRDELISTMMKEVVRLRTKIYCYLTSNNYEDKKAKDTKKGVIKRKFKFEDYKKCLEAAQIENKINHLKK